MSLRRSARTQSKSATSSDLPNGQLAEISSVPKKRGRKSKSTEDVAISAIAQEGSIEDVRSDSMAMPPPLKTPNKKRKLAAADTKPPPFTPTPSAIGLMAGSSSYGSGDVGADSSPPAVRPFRSNLTNATLVTPGGTQVQPTFDDFQESPSKPGARSSTTTANLLEKACAHLIKVDPTLRPVVEKFPCKIFSPEGLAEEIDPFKSLTSGIISQQVSGAAANSIKAKFIALFPPEACPRGFPPPSLVAKASIPQLREAGLSQRKAEYIQGLAEKFDSGELSVKMLMEASDEEVMESLVAVRGLGAWSVQMFMCFGLKRIDVFPTGDLGVQRGMAAHAGRDVKKLKGKGGKDKWKYMSEKEMLEISAKFAPYRSLFMWYMWRVEDVDTAALEDTSTIS